MVKGLETTQQDYKTTTRRSTQGSTSSIPKKHHSLGLLSARKVSNPIQQKSKMGLHLAGPTMNKEELRSIYFGWFMKGYNRTYRKTHYCDHMRSVGRSSSRWSLGGLGAVLLQKRSAAKVFCAVVFKSRTVRPPESDYSITEKESLAIREGIKNLRKYVLEAQQFNVITDHKPLQAMFNKTTGDLPPHIGKFIRTSRSTNTLWNTIQGKPTLRITFMQGTKMHAPSRAARRQRTSLLGLWFKRKG